jgi:hypothetical protein
MNTFHACFCMTPIWKLHGQPGQLFLDYCSHPKLLVCERCNGEKVIPCGATREDRCGECALRQKRRLKLIVGSGFVDRPNGFFFVTATAPGADRLPWDTSKCNHDSALTCGGKMGCQVERLPASQWNGCAPQAWSWVVEEVRRRLSGHQVEFWKCWESQERGVLHLHAVIWAAGVTEKRMKRVWKKALLKPWNVPIGNGTYPFVWGPQQQCDSLRSEKSVQEVIEEYGFDQVEAEEFVDAREKVVQLKAIRYVAKYCVKGGKRATVCSRVTGEIKDDGRGYRTWSASGDWGLRMKQVKQAQRDWCAQQALEAKYGASRTGSTPGSEATLDTNTDFYAGLVGDSAALTVVMPSKLV